MIGWTMPRFAAAAAVLACAAGLAGCSSDPAPVEGDVVVYSAADLAACGEGVKLPCRLDGPRGPRVTYVDANGERSTIAAVEWEELYVAPLEPPDEVNCDRFLGCSDGS
jgi:hypothetical protein